MSVLEDPRPGSHASSALAATGPEQQPSESRLLRAVEEYRALRQAGVAPDRLEFLARYPDIADALAECLDGLNLIPPEGLGLLPAGDQTGGQPAQGLGQLGDFRLLREIGRGGMGVVYEAEQLSLRRRVALKLLTLAGIVDPRQLQRFQNEAQAAAQLHHTNIVPVHFVGCERGVHYYAMQFIDGQALDAVIRTLRQQAGGRANRSAPSAAGPAEAVPSDLSSGRWAPARSAPPGGQTAAAETVPPSLAARATMLPHQQTGFFRTVAQLGVQAAEALEHAHQLGIIHRDIKPSNLLLDVRGNLWVADFGLARFHVNTGLTQSNDVMGTPQYMSPEQALAEHGLVDHRTDIYSLGATLYELLTLKPVFDGRAWPELQSQIAHDDPRPPRRWNPPIPPDLETIVLKALAKEPGGRYATAQELAADLRRFLEDKPIRAKRPTFWEVAAKWTRRHRTVMRAAGGGLLLAVVVLAVSTVLIALAYKAEADQRQKADLAYRAEVTQRQKFADLAKGFLTRVDDVLSSPLSKESIREKLLQDALIVYQKLLEEDSTDQEVRKDAGRAYMQVARIHERRVEPDKAAKAYGQAVVVWEKLKDDFPAEPLYPLNLARSCNGLVLVLYRSRPAEAAAFSDQALKLNEWLVANVDDDRKKRGVYQQDLAFSYHSRGLILQETGNFEGAKDAYQRARELRQDLVDHVNPDEPDLHARLADSDFSLGRLLQGNAQPHEAMNAFRRAVGEYQWLVDHNVAAEALYYRRNLARSFYYMGSLFEKQGQLAEAEKAYHRALDGQTKLAEAFPAMLYLREELATTWKALAEMLGRSDGRLPDLRDHYLDQAETLVRLADHAEAAKLVDRAMQTHQALPATEPKGQHQKAYYRGAQLLARCVPLAAQDVKLPEATRTELAPAYGDVAMKWLQEALRGERSPSGDDLGNDPAFDSLKPREDFQQLRRRREVPK